MDNGTILNNPVIYWPMCPPTANSPNKVERSLSYIFKKKAAGLMSARQPPLSYCFKVALTSCVFLFHVSVSGMMSLISRSPKIMSFKMLL